MSLLWTYLPPIFPRVVVEPAYAELRTAERLFGLKFHFAEAAGPAQVPGALAEMELERPVADRGQPCDRDAAHSNGVRR